VRKYLNHKISFGAEFAMVSPTKSESTEASQSDNGANPSAREAEWKQLVQEGTGAFERERYTVAEISFKSALELAEKLLEELTGTTETPKSAEPPKADLEAARDRLAKSLNNLAALYHVQGKYGLAEELYEKCLDLKLEMYGEEHLEVAVNLHNLAVLHSAKRKFPKAELLYKRAIEIREKLLGAEHKDLVPVLKNFALLLKKTNRADESAAIEQRVTAIEAT
jgi:tetratricopeptide (TPR) repeat protein